LSFGVQLVQSAPVFRHVPNLLTGSRLALALVFFCMLSWYQYEGRGDPLLLNIAFLVYLVALLTDYFDGYLARKWHVEGVFGRMIDPFVDKVLVLGAFAFFAGKNFIIPESGVPAGRFVAHTITGVTPTMVTLLLARELLVTTLRGAAEESGQNFAAEWSGKLKMVLQSITILAILVYVNYLDWLKRNDFAAAARLIRDIFIWTTVVATLASGLSYVKRAVLLYRRSLIKEEKGP
jgi:CDP-diacylglycerol---glycerol-3-phosphate 3-phosphatidyltransferase